MGGVIDDADPDWTLDFTRQGDTVVQMVRAKHPWAQEKSPISVKFTASFDAADTDLKASIERITGYGTSESVEFPVSRFEVTGPPIVAHAADDVIVKLMAAPGVDSAFPFQMVFESSDGSFLGSHTGVAVRGGKANLGHSVKTLFYGALTMTFLIPHEADARGSLQIDLDLARADPTTIVRVHSLLKAMEDAAQVTLKLVGEQFAKADLTTTRSAVPEEDKVAWRRYVQVAEDLELVQQHCGVFFPMPEEVDAKSRLYLRAARLLIEGQCVAIPGYSKLTATMNGNDSEQIREFFSGNGIILLDQEEFGFDLFGQTLILGHARTYASGVVIGNGKEAIAALKQKTAEGFRIGIKPSDAEAFWTFLIDKHQGEEWPRPVGWGLEDFTDPPDSSLEE